MEHLEKVTQIVRDYLEKNGQYYIPNFETMGEQTKEHIVGIGSKIMLKHWGLDDMVHGSFVESFLNNDLRLAVSYADNINVNCLRFYVMLQNNAGLEI